MRWLLLLALLLAGCSRFGPVYPSRPSELPGPPVADPAPSRVTVHVSVAADAVRASLEELVPKTGTGKLSILGSDRPYTWTREPLALSFSSGRVVVKTSVRANVVLPISSIDLFFDLGLSAEPIVNTAYAVKLQASAVQVHSDDRRLKIVDQFAGVFDRIGKELEQRLGDFSYDLRPLLAGAYDRLRTPVVLPMGDAEGCAELRVLDVEAAPLILADGLEKDFSLIVSPSITLPCGAAGDAGLPPLANVAMVPTGPFEVVIPVAAAYQELTRALGAAFTDGKLFFSSEHPKLYLEKPQVYESDGALVLSLHIAGPVHEFGIDADINGDLYLVGHPMLVDNEIQFPDLEPTIETKNFLLSLKAMTDSGRIREAAKRALRLDLADRLTRVRKKLSSELSFGDPKACFGAEVDKIEMTDLHAHAAYLRVHVAVTARASASMPCAHPMDAAPAPVVTPVEPVVTPVVGPAPPVVTPVTPASAPVAP